MHDVTRKSVKMMFTHRSVQKAFAPFLNKGFQDWFGCLMFHYIIQEKRNKSPENSTVHDEFLEIGTSVAGE